MGTVYQASVMRPDSRHRVPQYDTAWQRSSRAAIAEAHAIAEQLARDGIPHGGVSVAARHYWYREAR